MAIPKIAKVLTVIMSGLFIAIMYFVVLIAEDGYVEKKESSIGYPSEKLENYQPNFKNTCLPGG